MSVKEMALMRQLDIIPIDVLDIPVTIIGAGAIGGLTTLLLAKMGMEDITVIDFDTVSIENMGSQLYRFKDIEKLKVEALQSLVKDFTEVEIKIKKEKYEDGCYKGIVIAAVDSMAVRRRIWESHAEKSLGTIAIIDPRMGAEQALLYVMSPMDEEDCEAYPHTLYSDKDAVQERCTSKATIYTASMLSGLVVKAVKDLLTREDHVRCVFWDVKEDSFSGSKKERVK